MDISNNQPKFEITKSSRQKLVVRPIFFRDQHAVNVGVQTRKGEVCFLYTGGMNLSPEVAEELASALPQVAMAVRRLEQQDAPPSHRPRGILGNWPKRLRQAGRRTSKAVHSRPGRG